MTESEDQGLGYMLGLEGGAPREVIEAVKVYLCMIWHIRIEGPSNARGTQEYLPLEHRMYLGQDMEN